MHEIIINNLAELKNFAKDFITNLKPGQIVCLSGDLGAGKTAFVKCVAELYQIPDTVQSPTFNILLQYKNDDVLINHFDLYRLDNSEDLDDIGFYETLETDGITFIEWAEKFKSCMPEDAIWLFIKKTKEGHRKICYNHQLM